MKTSNWAKITNNLTGYALLLISLTAIISAVVYYLYSLNWLGIVLSLVLIIIIFIKLKPFFASEILDENKERQKISNRNKVYLGAYLLSETVLIILLLSGRSDRALISPWSVINPIFFCFYGLSSLLLILILVKKNVSAGLKIILISLHYLISFSVAVVIYKIGYGYDPFIHEKTMEFIAAKGSVLPKPPYYLGQYGLIVILHKISGLSISFLDKILVPALAALFLPPILYRFFKKEDDVKDELGTDSLFLAILFALALTFSPFIVTTPQNLSYLFLILTILSVKESGHPVRVLIPALATVAIHPLTGLPALGWAAWLIGQKYRNRLDPRRYKIIQTIIFLFTSLSLPLALLLAGGGRIKNAANNLFQDITNLLSGLGTAGREDWLSNFIYFFSLNYVLIMVLAAAGIILYCFLSRQQGEKNEKILKKGLLFITPALAIAYLLSSRIIFNDLISYEQADYASRIPIIILIFFLPFFLLALKRLITKIRQTNLTIQIIWLVFGLGLLGISLYISYPRFDKYWNSRGYSVSASDLAAVRSISQNTTAPYIVLANQQVGAAALKEFGFDHYYKVGSDQLYFYSIPTGGPLYRYYLEMIYKNPSRATMEEALKLAGVDIGYLVVNKYWYQSGQAINAAKLTADKWWTINNEDYIFRYQR